VSFNNKTAPQNYCTTIRFDDCLHLPIIHQ